MPVSPRVSRFWRSRFTSAASNFIAVVIGISTEIAELKLGIREAAAYFATVASILLTCLFIWFTLRFAQHFSRWIGREGMDALNRLMGFMMVCIGVQFVGSGVRTFMLGA